MRTEPKGFYWEPKGVLPKKLPLYRLPELLAADPTHTVWIAEGEKDALRLAEKGLVATCSPAGSSGPPDDLSVLGGRTARLVVDRDDAGEKSRESWSKALTGLGVPFDVVYPKPGHKGADASDHFDAGLGVEDFVPRDTRVWPVAEDLAAVGCAVPFPLDALPQRMREAVREVAERVMVDPALPGVAALGVAAGVLGPSTQVTLSGEWCPRANLYLVVVADSSTGKSPAFRPFTGVLEILEKALQSVADQERREAVTMLPILREGLRKLQHEDTPDRAAMATLQGKIEAADRARTRDARLVCDDTTPERMAELMADNGGRLIAMNDEGSILGHLLGMYAKSPNLDPFLKSWDGNPLTVDRKGGNGTEKTAIRIAEPLLTLVAAVQPTTMRRLGDTRRNDLEERGVLGRLLVAWPPVEPGRRLLAGQDHTHRYRAVPVWNDHLSRLARLGGEVRLSLTPEAQNMFITWHDEVEVQLRPSGVYAEVRTSAAKYRECAGRISGLFARLDGSTVVDVEHMRAAIELGDYFLAHAVAVAESWATEPLAVARRILTKVAQTGARQFSVRDAGRWARSVPKETLLEALEILEAHGCVRPADPGVGFGQVTRRVGGASPVVEVNPSLHDVRGADSPVDPPLSPHCPPPSTVVPVVPGSSREEQENPLSSDFTYYPPDNGDNGGQPRTTVGQRSDNGSGTPAPPTPHPREEVAPSYEKPPEWRPEVPWDDLVNGVT